MNSIKKILKKKRLLKSSKKRKQSTTQLESETIQQIKLTHKEQIHIKGQFQFVIVNGYLDMDLYEVRKPQIYEFNSNEFVSVIAHNVPQKIEDYLTKFQSSQIQSEIYLEFMNFILKNQPKELTLLIYGHYEISDFGYILTEQKQDLFDCQDRSVMFIGEKQVGKSTSLQLYANKLMNSNQVFILDTDLGQAIILPGFVTLIKLELPLFLSRPQILFQGFVGEFQVFNYFDLYFHKVTQALDVYNQSQLLKDYPLLINTAGFITSYGITIIQELMNILQPSKCILLSRDNHKKIMEKSNYLYDQLSKKSFISNFDTFKSQLQIVHEEIDSEIYGQTIQVQTPQIRKYNRTYKIAQNLGVENLNYLTLCSQTDIKIIDTNQCQFIVINEKKNYYDLEEIASVFIFNLVAVEQDGTFLGLGFIKDIDIIHNKIHIISQIEFGSTQYQFIKSKFYNITQDQLGEISVEDIYQLLDKECIQNGEPLDYLIELPYITQKSEAIGDFKHKITLNKKTF
ncbi:unnamed protein product [Paramecium primaurelia]|uniref:Clp1 P-loop domain-containing protein n=1 Tax=Paramecium primaurelia TaxID=5886 RepID=A0A8S1P625_PARPR|nr:unnamed protein product [Paramecium primaurelia]